VRGLPFEGLSIYSTRVPDEHWLVDQVTPDALIIASCRFHD